MRQVIVTVPFDKADLVVETIQKLGVSSVLRYNAEVASVVTAYASPQLSGYIMHELDTIGCGSAYGRIALTPVEVLKPLPKSRQFSSRPGQDQEGGEVCRDPATAESKDNGASVKARLAIEEIYSDVQGQSTISFDYIAFIVIGSMIAGLGLATNNTVMILASMLVSPLMGPILAFTFGTVVLDGPLVWKGVKMELLGVLLTIFVGFLMGMLLAGWGPLYEWPTPEMASRGEWATLLTGVLFAVPSGAGVALSTTGGGSNSLVGVAIAAALLPPIANTGLCYGYAAVGPFIHPGGGVDTMKFFRIGSVSLLLFLMNVFFIYVVGIIFFKIKKISPVRRELSSWKDLPKIEVCPPQDSGADSSAVEQEAETSQEDASAWKPSDNLMNMFGASSSDEDAKARSKRKWDALKAAVKKLKEEDAQHDLGKVDFSDQFEV